MRTRFSLRLSPFTSFPFSQARKHNWPEYSLWDFGPICIVGQLICMGPRSHLRRRLAYLPGTMVPPPSPVRLSAWDHGLTCIAGQVICLGPWSHFRRWSGYLLGPRSHLRRRSGYLPGTTVPLPSLVRLSAGTTVPPPSSVSLSAWDHGPTSVAGQVICWDHGPTCIVGTLLVWDNGSINACHEQVLACRHQPVERSNHAAGRLLQAMVKALLGSERSMLSEICKI
ncbi:Uncharacterised protein [Klebsiella pneumoniae]|nr:Uncharacterised protein [Klebsiella pneumoniae]